MFSLLRSGNYTLNLSAGSDGDTLLTSPSREKDVQPDNGTNNSETGQTTDASHNPSSSHDQSTTPSSNGIVALSPPSDDPSPSSPTKDQRTLLNSNENCSESNTDSNAANTDNSEAGIKAKANSKDATEQLPDGEVVNEEELQDNFR